jgi:hypothetical protein
LMMMTTMMAKLWGLKCSKWTTVKTTGVNGCTGKGVDLRGSYRIPWWYIIDHYRIERVS